MILLGVAVVCLQVDRRAFGLALGAVGVSLLVVGVSPQVDRRAFGSLGPVGRR